MMTKSDIHKVDIVVINKARPKLKSSLLHKSKQVRFALRAKIPKTSSTPRIAQKTISRIQMGLQGTRI